MANAKRDSNRVPTLIGASSIDGVTPVLVYADPTTHRLLVDSISGAAIWTPGVFTGDGVMTVFTLPTAASSFSSVFLFLNGQTQIDKNILSSGYDYTLGVDLQTITMVSAPLSTDKFVYKYQ